ncbi:MAG: DUF1795 domain-containing protein [Oscillatoria sp. SIO1A7]|nr:DUF1795 domain-containing protein [Oscillatoria sp. SIO1A7]
MNAPGKWICDGVPKDGKQYYSSGPHQDYENTGPDCVVCGLPREAMNPSLTQMSTTVAKTTMSQGSTPGWQKPLMLLGFLVIAVVAGLFAVEFARTDSRSETRDNPTENEAPLLLEKNYENTAYKFKLDYPKTWKLEKVERQIPMIKTTEVVKFLSPSEGAADTFEEVVTITIEEFSEPLTLDQYKDKALKEIEDFSSYTVEEKGYYRLRGDRPAYKIVYSGYNGQNNLKTMQVFTIKGGRQAYIITYAAEVAKYDKFAKEAEAIINSFELL